ncbi:MAG: hypothetical protein HY394_05325 [Candidatus Diapherotrites archaeon]|nr:hypothetical protein [Candidatus Diapherotrites archaeon]
MNGEFYDILLVDFSGIFPFKLEKEDVLTRQEQLSQHNLETFLLELEKNLGEELTYIGSDLLETKMFHRALLKDGLLELLIGTPITLLAHYKEEKKAKKFKESLERTLEKTIPEHLAPLIQDSIEIKKIKRVLGPPPQGFRKLGKVE